MNDSDARQYTNERKNIIEKIGRSYRKHSKFDEWKFEERTWKWLTGEDPATKIKTEPGAAKKRNHEGQVIT